MKKIIGIFALSALLFACDTTDETSLSGRTDVTYFKQAGGAANSGTINIDDTTQESINIGVAVSSPSSSARSIALEVDASSTAIDGTYEIVNTTLTIPANSVQGWITINGLYDEHIPSGSETLVLNISDVEGAQTTNPTTATTDDTFTLTINRTCTMALFAPTAPFTGNYSMVLTNDNNPFGAPAFNDQTVAISSNSATERQFSAVYLEGLGIGQPAMDFAFNFASCRSIVVNEDQLTGLGCGPGDDVLMGSDVTFGDYDYTDDSVFTMHVAEFTGPGACGITSPASFTLTFTKL